MQYRYILHGYSRVCKSCTCMLQVTLGLQVFFSNIERHKYQSHSTNISIIFQTQVVSEVLKLNFRPNSLPTTVRVMARVLCFLIVIMYICVSMATKSSAQNCYYVDGSVDKLCLGEVYSATACNQTIINCTGSGGCLSTYSTVTYPGKSPV